MSFRRDGAASIRWRRWKETHEGDLLKCGLPDFVLSSEHHWARFLEEGYDISTGWNVSLLAKDRQQALYDFIQREYGNDAYRGLLRELELQLGIAPAPFANGSP